MQRLLNRSNNHHLQALLALNRTLNCNIIECGNVRQIHLTKNVLEQIRLKMPAFSPTMTEGTIVKWHKKEGDRVSAGETLFEVQTDKAVLSFDLEEEGVLAKILKSDSQLIPVGTLVGILVTGDEDWRNVKIDEVPSTSAPSSSKPTEVVTQTADHQQQNSSKRQLNMLGPAAKSLINLYEIDITKIKGTGPHGLVLKRFVYISKYIRTNNLVVGSSSSSSQKQEQQTGQKQEVLELNSTTRPEQIVSQYTDIELTNMRKVIAKRLTLSKTTIPHTYLDAVCVMDGVMELRQELIKKHQLKLSLNDFMIKALALALRMVPEMNSVNESRSQQEAIYTRSSTVDVSVAVATDKGLITPIIKNADQLNVEQISKQLKQLAEKARLGKLLPHEFQGGTFSISNLGMFGVREFSAVINPPQSGILAVGANRKILLNTGNSSNGKLSVQNVCNVKLSFDERAVELDRAAQFLNSLKHFLKNPDLLSLDMNNPLEF